MNLIKWNITILTFQHETEYRNILKAVNGGAGEKRLASQFIARFFKYFQNLSLDSINALFDLCEDDDVMVIITSV